MTELLKTAIERLRTESDERQDAIAKLILADLREEESWDELFAASPEVLDKLAAEAIAEHKTGLTEELKPETL